VRLRVPLVALITVIAAPASAHATWSIVAVDPDTQQVGVAVASCVEAPFGTTILPDVAGVVPGVGALAAQALYDADLRDYAVEQLASGLSPEEVIEAVLAVDNGDQVRQYGVVTLDGATANFTGDDCQDWAGGVEATHVSVQGNILYGPEVADDALAAFLAEAPSCPFTLADRLMLALEAGAAQGGDNRCSMEQSALAAVIIVADADDDEGAPTLDLRVPSQDPGGESPVALLRIEYDAWRLAHPPDASRCDAGTSTGADESTTSDGSATTAGAGGSTSSTSTTTSTSTSTSTGAASASTEGSSGDAGATGGNDGGCSCTVDTPAFGAAWLVLLLRRRRQRLRTTL
jgi:MYXO-CTERM domain-containing protein